jgi:hypothetical protein
MSVLDVRHDYAAHFFASSSSPTISSADQTWSLKPATIAGRAIQRLLRARGIEDLVLVTSQTHMRRSLAVFRAQGWPAVPAIAPDPDFSASWRDWLLPTANGLDLSHQIVHELIGLPYYWIRGWER